MLLTKTRPVSSSANGSNARQPRATCPGAAALLPQRVVDFHPLRRRRPIGNVRRSDHGFHIEVLL